MEKINTFKLRSIALENKSTMVQALWIVAFTALTAIGAQIEIPNHPVPFTLQTFFVLLAGAMLGKRNGAISQLLYLLVGVTGVPVFSGFGFGVAKLLGPTGGYLLSFPVAAFVVGYLIQNHRSFLWSLVSMIVGSFIIFSFGTVYLNFVYFHDWSASITSGFLIFSLWDGLKIVAAASIACKITFLHKHRTLTSGSE